MRLILEVIKLLTSEKNVIEVANRRKVKKGGIFGRLLLLYMFFNKATEVSAGAMVLILTRAILISLARSALSYSCYDCMKNADTTT